MGADNHWGLCAVVHALVGNGLVLVLLLVRSVDHGWSVGGIGVGNIGLVALPGECHLHFRW